MEREALLEIALVTARTDLAEALEWRTAWEIVTEAAVKQEAELRELKAAMVKFRQDYIDLMTECEQLCRRAGIKIPGEK